MHKPPGPIKCEKEKNVDERKQEMVEVEKVEKGRTMLKKKRETVMKTKDAKSTFQNGCGVGVLFTALCGLVSLKI